MKNIALYTITAVALLMAACTDGWVTGVKIEPDEVMLSVGESLDLTATITPKNAKEKTVYWFTSDPERVTVDKNGRITCVAEWTDGTYVSIGARTKEGANWAFCYVRFVPGGTLKLSENILIMSVGEKHTLTAYMLELFPTYQNITWSSSAPQIASVNAATGEVTAIANGTTTIIATTQDGGRTATCTILVDAEILLSEDFEVGFGTSLAGWTFENGAFSNRWHVGAATARSGNQSCYISNNNSDNRYGNNSSNVRFYRELNVVSTSANPVIVSFDWKAELLSNDRTNDYLEVSILSDGELLFTPMLFRHSPSWQRREIVLPAMSGTIRVVFFWTNQSYSPSYNETVPAGAAIDNIVIYRR